MFRKGIFVRPYNFFVTLFAFIPYSPSVCRGEVLEM